jgi:hypothetical protein
MCKLGKNIPRCFLGVLKRVFLFISLLASLGTSLCEVLSSQQKMNNTKTQYCRAVRYRDWDDAHSAKLRRAKKSMIEKMKNRKLNDCDIISRSAFDEPDEVAPWFVETETGKSNNGIVWNYYYRLKGDYELGEYPDEWKIVVLFDKAGIVQKISEKRTRFDAHKDWEKDPVSQTIGDEKQMNKLLKATSKFRIGMKREVIISEYGLPNIRRRWLGVKTKDSGMTSYYQWFYEAINAKGDKYEICFSVNENGIIVKIDDYRLKRFVKDKEKGKFAPTYYQKGFVYPYELDEMGKKRILDALSSLYRGMDVEDIIELIGKPDEVTRASLFRPGSETYYTNLTYYLRAHAGPAASYYDRNEWKIVFQIDADGKIAKIINLDSEIWPPL